MTGGFNNQGCLSHILMSQMKIQKMKIYGFDLKCAVRMRDIDLFIVMD